MKAKNSANKGPDFFEETPFDPVLSATGGAPPPVQANPALPKKKAGFYLSAPLLERFNRKFHEMKLADAAVDNKSSLLEVLLEFALDDLDRGECSRVRQKLA
jgi:hypothetical protein